MPGCLHYTLGEDEQVAFSTIKTAAGNNSDIVISGPSNTYFPTSYVYLDQDYSTSGTFKINQGAYFKAEGNYNLSTNYFRLDKRNNLQQGTTTLFLKGISSTERLSFSAGNDVKIGEANDGDILVEFAGFTTFTGASRFQLGYIDTIVKGNTIVKISGQENIFSAQSLNVGSNTADENSSSILQIEGSSQTIDFNPNNYGIGFRVMGHANSTADNIRGGAIKFIADTNGISTINAEKYTDKGAADFTNGVFILDLSNYNFTDSTADFNLISTTSKGTKILDAIDTWIAQVESGVNLFKVIGENVKDYTLSANDTGLWVNVSAVPEPSVYAAIFGALALGFATYRRRK